MLRIHLRRHIVTLFAVTLLLLPALATAAIEQQRQLYKEALQAREAKDHGRYTTLKRQLAGYPLYPYLDYEELISDLSGLTRDRLERFRSSYDSTPLPRLLHRHWLAYLAKRQRWADYVEQFDPDIANTALTCSYHYALLKTGRVAEAFQSLEQLWVVGRSQSDACDPLFASWLKSEYFSPNFAWQRFWLALANNKRSLATYTMRFVDDTAQNATMQQGLDYHRHPEKIAKLSTSQFAGLPSRVRMIAMTRLSRSDPNEFLRQRERLGLTTSTHYQELAEAAVMRLLRSYDKDAGQWAERVDPAFRSQELLEWRIRDALFREDWPTVGLLLKELSASSRFNDRWRYWQAVFLDKGTDQQRRRGEQIFSELARSRSFYGFLAADRLGSSYSLTNHSEPASAGELAELNALPGLQRARELFIHDQLIEARREWSHASAGMDEQNLYRLAQLARSWGWYAQAIQGTIAAKRWDDLVLRFPLAHNQHAAQLARKHRIDTTWIMAIIRQESAFMADARSGAGAMGLMQLMPATARQTARTQKLKYRNASQLHDPQFNMELGSAYLGQMYRRFNNHRALASAAYNAGPHRVSRWLEQRGHLPIDAWVETIPFDETRHYVQNVLAYALIYSDLLGLPKQFLPGHERQPLRSETSP